MTVTYTARVSSSALHFGCFLKLLGKWRGSIYKLVWRDFMVYVFCYLFLSVLYRFVLSPHQQYIFEKMSYYCDKHSQLIPVSFVLGFYVSLVVGRWWQQFQSIPFIDSIAILVKANLRGHKDKDRLLRRTIIRYVCLSMVQCFVLISPRIKKRFPTQEHLVDGGLLLENEKAILKDISSAVPKFPTSTTFVPMMWAAEILTRARLQNKIKSDPATSQMLGELNTIKDKLNMLMCYDWVSVPLVYTQVVTLAVYTYFLSCLMGRQWLFNREGVMQAVDGEVDLESHDDLGDKWNELDIFLPIFTILQFLFTMGWLKTAESLLNPFGDDDDDFELNWFVDRNLQVGYLIVDGLQKEFPELLKDHWWDEVVPPELPYTLASSERCKEEPMIGSTAGVKVSEKGAEVLIHSVSTGVDLTGGMIDQGKPSSSSLKLKPKVEPETPSVERPTELKLKCKFQLGDDEEIDNMDTIHWDALTPESEKKPSIQAIFNIPPTKKEDRKEGEKGKEEEVKKS